VLLDDYPAFAGFSTRALRTAYAGSCLRVRRSSDDEEQDIGFVSGSLDTASLLTFVGANDGFVATWYDQSGGGNDATAASDAEQPQIVVSGVTQTLLSRPSLRFDGTDDAFLFDTDTSFPFSISIVTQAYFPVLYHFYRISTNGYSPAGNGAVGIGLEFPYYYSGGGAWLGPFPMFGGHASYSTKNTGVEGTSSPVYGVCYPTINSYAIYDEARLFKSGGSTLFNSLGTQASIGAGRHTSGTGFLNYAKIDLSEFVLWSTDESANMVAIQTNQCEWETGGTAGMFRRSNLRGGY